MHANDVVEPVSPAWRAQVWIAFTVSVGAMAAGIFQLEATAWAKGFFAMGLLFTVGSSLSLAKTLRDLHEAQRVMRRLDDARVQKLIAEHDPLAPPR